MNGSGSHRQRALRGLAHLLAVPPGPPAYRRRLSGFRVLALAAVTSGTIYLVWRYAASLNPQALWFAIPLVVAETYSLGASWLFMIMMWRPPRRDAPAPPASASVDVFITTYNEPVDLVRLTAAAACRIRWPEKRVHILDDGARPEVAGMARELGCSYITRGEEWTGKPRHAKAGNINNALLQTTGEFILTLDADQIPAPEILERTLGYFQDPRLAFVQTPQCFYNLPSGDPFGSDAPLFYGPIQQGKDGWNAAFYCGSNAVLRREALMQLGLTDYVAEMEAQMRRGLERLERDLHGAPAGAASQRAAAIYVRESLRAIERTARQGRTLQAVSEQVQETIGRARQMIALEDLGDIAESLEALSGGGDQSAGVARQHILDHLQELSEPTAPSAEEGLGVSPEALESLSLTRAAEAIPIQAVATISITEDMATAMRLHALGWRSAFHSEILAYGLAPEDLGSALIQRLRWAQGTIQVLLRQNPLLLPGLNLAQRLQYFTTMYSYFGGFASLIYLTAPVIYLFTQIPPVNAWSWDFLSRLVPYLLLNLAMFRYVAWGLSIWRSEQFSVALFPVWIQAVWNGLLDRRSHFRVTPKHRQGGTFLRLIWLQLLIIALSALGILNGLRLAASGEAVSTAGIVVNLFWASYNIIILSAVARAAVYRPPAGWRPRPPDFLYQDHGDRHAGDSS